MTEFVGSVQRPRADSDTTNGLNTPGDPFTIETPPSSQQNRFSAFDTQLFALNHPDSSPAQAKRALEAHLADTERRIQEASKLGNALVQQRINLSSRLREVASQGPDSKINPDLRQKLVDIEREYNEVGRQSAKTLLAPKSDGPGFEGPTPSVRDSNRPPSPSKLASTAIDTPSKISVPRKQRNQASSSDHIEFAAEITTSLLGQVRHLQAVLAERDDTLKSVNAENERLESEAAGFGQRLKQLDDSEQRYKDENWNLETQLQELLAQQKDAASKEQKLHQNLAALTSERTAYEKELEDLKQSQGKAYDDHTALRKHHESEIASLRKSFVDGEDERESMQRKVDELTSHNQELAKVLAIKMKDGDRRSIDNAAVPVEDFQMDALDLEHSPPPSPSKGGQRHSMLESETLKSSLHHAHRMIQNLKSSVNRERSENKDLKRMLQDARDDVDARRAEPQGKRMKTRSQTDMRKAGKAGLGAARMSKTDVTVNDPTQDPEWEDHDGDSPQRLPEPKAPAVRRLTPTMRTESSDAYQTATENSDAFETANERESTDNDAFQTGAESMADESETETETETAVTRVNTVKGAKVRPTLATKSGDRQSFQSTASTSDDEAKLQTPIQGQPQRFRLKMNRRSQAAGAAGSSAPTSSNNSPASFVNQGAEGGQSLFAELENVSDDETTPSRTGVATPRSVRSTSRDVGSKRSSGSLRRGAASQHSTPGLRSSVVAYTNGTPPVPKIPTVDSGIMTEPWEPSSLANGRPGSRVVSDSTSNSTPQRAVWDQPLNVISGMIPGFRDSVNTTPMSSKSDGSQIRRSVVESEPTLPSASVLALSPIRAIETSPVRSSDKNVSTAAPDTPTPSSRPTSRRSPESSGGIFGSVFGWNRRSRTASVTRAVDDKPDQPTLEDNATAAPEKKQPLQEVSANVMPRGASEIDPSLPQKEEKRRPIYDQASQTVLSSEQIDRMLHRETVTADRQFAAATTMKPLSDIGASADSPVTPTRNTQDDMTPRAKLPEVKIPQGAAVYGKATRRPTSSQSMRAKALQYPPLPADHQEAIAAAAQRDSAAMPPPLTPASAYTRSLRSRAGSRPQTPSIQGVPSPASRAGTTPRAGRYSTTSRSQVVSRRSSVSSFASELDERFGIRMNGMPMQGMPANTDPRMIQAITQTMIGEHMWKYTRKAGRGDMSNSRHRRFFWVHPYTRTLYWSDRDPATANRAELKSKSVAIEAVRVVTDDNPNPPGLHRKSLIIVTPGRSVKFTAQTSHRHETWFNALSYLLLRTGGENENADGDYDANDVAEFNPNFNRRSMRSRVSLASFRSSNTATRNVRSSLSSRPGTVNRTSNQIPVPPEIPDERDERRSGSVRSRISRSLSRSRVNKASISNPIPKAESNNATAHNSISSRLSGYWRQPPSIRNSMRSRSSIKVDNENRASTGVEPGVLEGGRSVVSQGAAGDSAEDLRRVIEERENQPGLENVRACCEGRHDVGSLSKDGRHSHSHSHGPSHAHSTQSLQTTNGTAAAQAA